MHLKGRKQHPPDGTGEGAVLELDATDVTDREKPDILCASCHHALTKSTARVSVDGKHCHVKVNPGGHVYTIYCFRPVPGIEPVGTPCAEFSWFSGYRWQIARCAGCGIHVGWRFDGTASFVALIEGRFMEQSDD